MKVVYEDNHIIIVQKKPGEIVQGDITGDRPLSEMVKDYLKEKYDKPGNVFIGVVHRLDRPVGGLVIFAKTSKALSRLNLMLKEGKIHKTYWAIVHHTPPKMEDELRDYITRNTKINKSFVSSHSKDGAQLAVLRYKTIAQGEKYTLVEIRLLTGRHHQIRCQLSSIGCPIKGDLKYGAARSNPDGSISLLARNLRFEHPVSHEIININAEILDERLWQALSKSVISE